MSFTERLSYAIHQVPAPEWPDRFGRSAKQLHRYLDGADVPFSVLTMVSAMTGVPVDWLASGRPTYGRSEHDEWRESLAPDGVAVFPGSARLRSVGKSPQPSDTTGQTTDGEAEMLSISDFRVLAEKSEASKPSRGLFETVDIGALAVAMDYVEGALRAGHSSISTQERARAILLAYDLMQRSQQPQTT